MKARTLGPILMMTMGAAVIFAPATGWVGAGDIDPCLVAGGAVQVVDPCCPDPATGIVGPCATTTIAATTTTVAATTTTAAATTTLAATTTVVLPTTTDLGSGGQGLPATGGTSSSYVVLGGLMLIGGAGLLVLGRGKSDAAAN